MFRAESGGAGGSRLKKGGRGRDLEIFVPFGTVLRDAGGKLLKDLKEDTVWLKGGKGGKGNAYFKNSVNQAPRKILKGSPGLSKQVILEYKPVCDVGLIGKTNIGKSTFLNHLTKAKSPRLQLSLYNAQALSRSGGHSKRLLYDFRYSWHRPGGGFK